MARDRRQRGEIGSMDELVTSIIPDKSLSGVKMSRL